MNMYYKRNSFEVSIPVNDLKPGMMVCVPRSVTYGWHQYTGLTIYKPCTIKRVTPTFPDAKRPRLCVEKGNSVTAYATFRNEECAEMFMNELIDMFGLKKET